MHIILTKFDKCGKIIIVVEEDIKLSGEQNDIEHIVISESEDVGLSSIVSSPFEFKGRKWFCLRHYLVYRKAFHFASIRLMTNAMSSKTLEELDSIEERLKSLEERMASESATWETIRNNTIFELLQHLYNTNKTVRKVLDATDWGSKIVLSCGSNEFGGAEGENAIGVGISVFLTKLATEKCKEA